VADAKVAAVTSAAHAATGAQSAFRRLTTIVCCGILPALVFALVLHDNRGADFAVDFHRQFWPVADRVLHGLSPYDLSWQDIQHEIAFPYGALAAVLFTPFGLLPHGVADIVFTILCVAAAPLSLFVLGVREWRVYGVVFLWLPVIAAWTSANVSLLLVFGIALMWCYRDRALVTGLMFALLVSVKLFVWPLAIWLLATRRYAALGYAMLTGLALNIAAWAIVGFDQLGAYVKVLGLVTDREEPHGVSILAVIRDAGASRPVAYAVTLALAAGAAWACVALARRERQAEALLLAVATCFLATPVIWAHYFVLLIVPLALIRPRLDLVWWLPVAIVPVAGLLLVVGQRVPGQLAVIAATIAAALHAAKTTAAATQADVRAGGPREFAAPARVLPALPVHVHD
jgi:hypothetical protein